MIDSSKLMIIINGEIAGCVQSLRIDMCVGRVLAAASVTLSGGEVRGYYVKGWDNDRILLESYLGEGRKLSELEKKELEEIGKVLK